MSTHVRHIRSKIPSGVLLSLRSAKSSQLRLASSSSSSSSAASLLSKTNAFISGVDEEANPPLPPLPDATRIRLAVKDNIAAQGLPTTCASHILTGHEVPFTATIVQQIRERLGAELWGKTNMDEFGMGTHSTNTPYGSVSNPASPRLRGRSAGGSSGGSAVAVSLCYATVALGTDTGGSIRMPAAYTSTVGFKPSYGMLSRWGVVPYANSLDTVGLIAREVAPIEKIIHAVCMEHDPKDPTSLPPTVRQRCVSERQYYPSSSSRSTPPPPDLQSQGLRGLTFGMPLEYNIEELSPRIKEGWMRVADKIKEHGGRVVPVSLPSTKTALSAYYVIAPAEAASNLSKYDGIRYGKRATAENTTSSSSSSNSDALNGILYAKTRGEGFGPEVKRRILLGSYTLSSEAVDNYFKQAQRVRRLVRRDFDRIFRLANPLLEGTQHFDLSDLDASVPLESKRGPAQVDFLLCPTAPTTPPRLDDVVAQQTPFDSYVNDVFTVPASLAGLPAISIPMALPESEDDLVDFGGVQLIGQYWDDARLLAVAGHIRSTQ